MNRSSLLSRLRDADTVPVSKTEKLACVAACVLFPFAKTTPPFCVLTARDVWIAYFFTIDLSVTSNYNRFVYFVYTLLIVLYELEAKIRFQHWDKIHVLMTIIDGAY